jgi:hypothetical protein
MAEIRSVLPNKNYGSAATIEAIWRTTIRFFALHSASPRLHRRGNEVILINKNPAANGSTSSARRVAE